MVQLFFFSNIFMYILNILITGIVLSYILMFLHSNFLNSNNTLLNLIRIILLLSISISFFFYIIFIFFFYKYFCSNINYSIFSVYCLIPTLFINMHIYFFEFSIDFFGIIILFLAYFVGLLSLLALDNRIFYKNVKYLFSINIFILFVFFFFFFSNFLLFFFFFFVFSSNLLLFFLFYELLLLPSFLVVYFISPSRRAIQASIYFLIWTQIGSILVLLVITYILVNLSSFEFFTIKNYTFSYNESYFLFLFLFLGFGFKVPIWPFHYWLTKTHVEAPAGFSMFLSGFLVKTAIYGFYKITLLLNNELNTSLFITICIVGVIDSSLKMWGQTDLKKLVAYCTIQEMNLIYLTLCWGDSNMVITSILFIMMHGLLSTLMFFIVDCVQRRFNSRSVVELSGILQITPSLGISILFMCILYSGLPGMLKFSCEFYLFSNLFSISPTLTIVLFFISNVIGLISFSKCWFNVTFGIFNKNLKFIPFDLNIKELYIIYLTSLLLIILTLSCSIFF